MVRWSRHSVDGPSAQRAEPARGAIVSRILTLAAACAGFGATDVLARQQRPAIFDWDHRYLAPNVPPEIIPVPHPGADGPPDWQWYTNQLYPMLTQAGYPLSMMIQDLSSPVCGTHTPETLPIVLEYLDVPLKYVFADIETSPCAEEDVFEIVELVRESAVHHNAKIGAYQWYPGATDRSVIWPNEVDRTEQHELYVASGLNIAMPDCYPYASYSVHTETWLWQSDSAPNIRSAIFWAPLERFSVAKRNLLQGHLLIPWLAGYVPWPEYPYEAPPIRDMKALVKHMRLRGARGYFTLNSGMDEVPEWIVGHAPESYFHYASPQYRKDMLQAWKSLDHAFTKPSKVRYLNLKTNKTLGVQTSGVLYGTNWNKVCLLISNLRDDVAVRVPLPRITGLPKYLDMPCGEAGGGEHAKRIFTVAPVNPNAIPPWKTRKPGDINVDWVVNEQDLDLMIAAWGPCPTPRCYNVCPADLTGDGIVDSDDLFELLDHLQ